MFTKIPSATLRQLVKLSERKEALMHQIQEIDREMLRLQAPFDRPERKTKARSRVTVSDRSRRGKR